MSDEERPRIHGESGKPKSLKQIKKIEFTFLRFV